MVAVIGILIGFLIPAFSAARGSGARKSAVTLVMNSLERARVAAIEQGRETLVLFWMRNGHAGPGDDRDALMVLRRNDQGGWEPVTRWLKLPQGVLFDSAVASSEILAAGKPALRHENPAAFPGSPSTEFLGAVRFGPTGAVQAPNAADALFIPLAEGHRNSDGTITAARGNDETQEVVSIVRFTGRALFHLAAL